MNNADMLPRCCTFHGQDDGPVGFRFGTIE